MNYLIDTCVISELAKPKPEKSVIQWIEGCNEDVLFLSVLTIGEIQKGIVKVSDKTRRIKLQQWLDAELRPRFARRTLSVTEEVAMTWGLLQGRAEAGGRPVPTIDGLLAATALAHNATLVTRNDADFIATGAMLLNPWE
ncbi:MAG: type II toxin-antitoxin system VapC family toxin [Chitinispirillaceae bacterium]|nr:type II toxin-antitoxin system VapC family toxin [Chitinispirillaceae bacterium]